MPKRFRPSAGDGPSKCSWRGRKPRAGWQTARVPGTLHRRATCAAFTSNALRKTSKRRHVLLRAYSGLFGLQVFALLSRAMDAERQRAVLAQLQTLNEGLIGGLRRVWGLGSLTNLLIDGCMCKIPISLMLEYA